ncbi:DUF3780 domain-containing protein [bacterium]|nr:DUF3780 domain-containing protein [bacterium]
MSSKFKYDGFGFCPEESEHHFLVTIPAGNQRDVLISEFFTFDPKVGIKTPSLGDAHDGQLKVILPRSKWDAIADEVRAELNKRLKAHGIKTGVWKVGTTPVSRLLGKELVLLAWAIEDADPATIPTAIRNWLGLAQEERWWLYTMTNAATGHAASGRGKGWRKAVRFALTENPISDTQRVFATEHFNLFPLEAATEARTEVKTPSKRGRPRKVSSGNPSLTKGPHAPR